MGIRACLIDVDGTAVLSEQRNRVAIEDVARDGGFTITPDHWEHGYTGAGDDVIWTKICAQDPEFINSYPTAESFENACIEGYSKKINEVKVNEPVRDLVHYFQERAVKVCIVSNSITSVANDNLRHTDYPVDEFDVMICKDDVRKAGLKTKPSADPYVLALKILNEGLSEGVEPIKPEECLVLEDSKTGARAGLRFGATVIQLLDDDSPLPRKERKVLTEDFNSIYHGCLLNTLHDVCYSVIQEQSHSIKAAVQNKLSHTL